LNQWGMVSPRVNLQRQTRFRSGQHPQQDRHHPYREGSL
jgi:hypothetical protein